MKKLAFIGLILALILTVLSPATVLAAKPAPFYAQGIVTGITPGDVFPAGNSGRFVVVDRTISGVFVAGDIPVFQPHVEKKRLVAYNADRALELFMRRDPLAPVFTSIADVVKIPKGLIGSGELMVKHTSAEDLMRRTRNHEG